MSTLLRSERTGAILLLIAAAIGLILANSPLGGPLADVKGTYLAIPGTPIELSVGHWISDGLLAVFFFTAAIELRHELTRGQLNTVTKALHPAIAALGGIVVPAAVYLLIAGGSGYAQGWPIPTATDIAFAMGVLAVFGKGLPSRLRIFLLALAILDDIVAILIIALFFTTDPQMLYLAVAAVLLVAFALLGRRLDGRGFASIAVGALMVGLAVAVWCLVLLSGVHATIAGVALGLAMPNVPAARIKHAVDPFVNGAVLPIFALSAAFVVIPQVPLSELSAPFWGILIALPVGKIIGIALGGWLGSKIGPREARNPVSFEFLLAAGALGGIGFTVSLLMNELAFAGDSEVVAEGTLAVLGGSVISLIISAVVVSSLAAKHRRRARIRREVHAAHPEHRP